MLSPKRKVFQILLLESKKSEAELMACALNLPGLNCICFNSEDEALKFIQTRRIDLLIKKSGRQEAGNHSFIQRIRSATGINGPAIYLLPDGFSPDELAVMIYSKALAAMGRKYCIS